MTRTRPAPSAWVSWRKAARRRWAASWVMPCRSTRASMVMRPRATLVVVRRSRSAGRGVVEPGLGRGARIGRDGLAPCEGVSGFRSSPSASGAGRPIGVTFFGHRPPQAQLLGRGWARTPAHPRALSTNAEAILFLDWGGEPASKRSTGDASASFQIGSGLGACQSRNPKGWPILRQFPRQASRPYPDTLVKPSRELVTKSLRQNGSELVARALGAVDS